MLVSKMKYYNIDRNTRKVIYPCPKEYEICQDTYEILKDVVEDFGNDRMFVFRDTRGNHYAVIHHEIWVGPTKRYNGISNPAYCVGRITSGHYFRFGIEVLFEIDLGPCVFKLDVRRDHECCMNCGYMDVDENSGCYDMDDNEIPMYSCPYGGNTEDSDDIHYNCCRYWIPYTYDAIKERIELIKKWHENKTSWTDYEDELRWLQATLDEIEERRKSKEHH